MINGDYVGNYTPKVIIGCVCGVAGSWAIGSFFMLPLLIPAQVSSVEEKLTGRNQSAMYFAGQALFTCVIQTFMVLCMAYTLSRLRFKGRKLDEFKTGSSDTSTLFISI